MADAARADVEVLLVDGQCGEIGDRRRGAEPSDLQDVGPALELCDVAVPLDEHLLARSDPDRAYGRDLARGRCAQSVLDDLSLFEIRDLGGRRPELARQGRARSWGCRSDRTREEGRTREQSGHREGSTIERCTATTSSILCRGRRGVKPAVGDMRGRR